jgi:hypothetical protein
MADPTSAKVGRGRCLNAKCGQPVTYRRSAGGKIKATCDACDLSMYAPIGSDAERDALATMEPEKAPNPTPTPAPAVKPRSFFDEI